MDKQSAIERAVPLVFMLSNKPHVTIAEVFHTQRNITGTVTPMRGREEIRKLNELLRDKTLTNGNDKIEWKWNITKKFTVKSCYKFFSHGGVTSQINKSYWKILVPEKVKLLNWLAINKKLLT